MNEIKNHPCFFIKLNAFALWPLTLGPFTYTPNPSKPGAVVGELKTLLDGLRHQFAGIIYSHPSEVGEVAPWQSRETLLKYGIGEHVEDGPNSVAALPLLRYTLAYNYLAQSGYRHHSEAHGVALELSVDALALGMEANIEGALIEVYGSDQGRNNAILMYINMLGSNGLAESGREMLAELLESISETAVMQGSPAPAWH